MWEHLRRALSIARVTRSPPVLPPGNGSTAVHQAGCGRRWRGTRSEVSERMRTFVIAQVLATTALLLASAGTTEAGARDVVRTVSPCGRHVVEVVGGKVRLDGRDVEASGSTARVIVAPKWRRDSGAVAWVERVGAERRLIVLPAIGSRLTAISWSLPPAAGPEHIFWAGSNRIVVG